MAKKNPFDDDDDDKGAVAANRAAASKLEERIEERKEAKQDIPKVPSAPIEIDLEEAEEAVEDDEQAPASKTRWQRRQERYRQMQDREQEASRRAEAAEKREADARQLLATMQGHLAQQFAAQQRPAEKVPDPLDARLDSLFNEQDLLYREYNSRSNQMTAAEHADFAKRQRALSRQMMEIGGELAVRKLGVGRNDPEQTRSQIVAQELHMRHGDVLRDERMRMYADGVWRQLRAKGREDDWSTIDDAFDQTRKAFGLRPKNGATAPSAGYKAKLQGNPRGMGGNGSEGRQVVTMTKEFQQMANAVYEHVKDPQKRYRMWAAGPGRRLLEKQKQT